MNFLRSRSEQLAEYLRTSIARGELVEPLPGTRAWAEKLEVSPTTLKLVLKILQREGLIVIEPRKPIRLARASVPRPISASKLVRVVYCAAEYPDRSMFAWFPELAQSLFEHGIHAALESCTFARLRALSRQNPALPELLVLASIPAEYQPLFAPLKHRALLHGHPHPNSPLSYVNADVNGAVRHATHSLLRKGLRHLSFVLEIGTAQGLSEAIETFQQTARCWPQQPIHTEVVRIGLSFESMARDIERFAARVRPQQGIVVLDPTPVGMTITALLERGLTRDAVEFRALMTTPGSLHVCHPPPTYPFPLKAMVKETVRVIVRYFETGVLPRVRKTVPVELVESP